ncbi:drug/metabolite transporter (DMT)-like permease [Lysinibacillus composti]|uniref:DMT family transporter n=1 Tax=Lysinibacillus composti TaxID=720633 RepID=A0A3N9UEM0_9BACI|nr:DMT family transporter [Lysinibacillus composti]MBM7608796.1 drug/metabolite transporter (DMT)-like permease [Lysinibacillus composti]RQW74699.1 DMT family transporter [Lysinibacillus composti]HWJ79238.1 DMT family transporter [Niallia sp.]
MRNNVLWGSFLCFLAAVSWGAMFPVAHAAFKHIDPFYFTIIRYGAVTVILVALLLWKEGKQAFRFEGKGLPLWFFGTMAFTIYNLLIFWGEDMMGESGVMVASIMESLMPMISIVIVWMIFKKRPHLFTLICVIVSLIGAILVITKGDIKAFLSATNNFIPTILILVAVIGWVIYTMGGSEFSSWSVLRYSTLSCLLGTITAVVIVVGATVFGYISIPTKEVMIVTSPHLIFMIIFPGLIALLGWNVGVSILSPINALLFINFVPVTTLIISIYQGNNVTIYDILGTVFIIISLVANNIFVRMQMKGYKQLVQTNMREQVSQ